MPESAHPVRRSGSSIFREATRFVLELAVFRGAEAAAAHAAIGL